MSGICFVKGNRLSTLLQKLSKIDNLLKQQKITQYLKVGHTSEFLFEIYCKKTVEVTLFALPPPSPFLLGREEGLSLLPNFGGWWWWYGGGGAWQDLSF